MILDKNKWKPLKQISNQSVKPEKEQKHRKAITLKTKTIIAIYGGMDTIQHVRFFVCQKVL